MMKEPQIENVLVNTSFEPVKLYHGTSVENAKRIMQCGELRPNKEYIDQSLFFTDILDMGKQYGETHGTAYIVLEVDVTGYEVYYCYVQITENDSQEIQKHKKELSEYYTKQTVSTDSISKIYYYDGEQMKMITVDELLKV